MVFSWSILYTSVATFEHSLSLSLSLFHRLIMMHIPGHSRLISIYRWFVEIFLESETQSTACNLVQHVAYYWSFDSYTQIINPIRTKIGLIIIEILVEKCVKVKILAHVDFGEGEKINLFSIFAVKIFVSV